MNQRRSEFLQSKEWLAFQEAFGRKTHFIQEEAFSCGVVEHTLPLVGKYFYLPRGPVIEEQEASIFGKKIVSLAKENGAGWIRIEPETEELLEAIKKYPGELRPRRIGLSVQKAPHDVQPREVFLIDIAKSEDELLAQMKPKTRYNMRLAEKKGVVVSEETRNEKELAEFLRLTGVMAKRQGIKAHPKSYYRKMLESISGDILKLYVAKYQGKTIAANLVVFWGDTCTYLHGASDDNFRNVMAPYLLQWRQIQDAKKAGCVRYDFGGVKTGNMKHEIVNEKNPILKTDWGGITKFKIGFSPTTLPTNFPGSYDLVISPGKYFLYRIIQKMKTLFGFFRN